MKKKKYKGKICTPDAATTAEHKNTKLNCGGKNGLPHEPMTFYDTKPDKNWGLASHQWQDCARCGKHLSFRWSERAVHPFGAVVHAIRTSKGMEIADLAGLLGVPVSLVEEIESGAFSGKTTLMRAITDALDVEIQVEIRPRNVNSFFNGVCVETKAKP